MVFPSVALLNCILVRPIPTPVYSQPVARLRLLLVFSAFIHSNNRTRFFKVLNLQGVHWRIFLFLLSNWNQN
jgi:hypothetical protein